MGRDEPCLDLGLGHSLARAGECPPKGCAAQFSTLALVQSEEIL